MEKRQVGRPRKAEKREKIVLVRLTEREYEYLFHTAMWQNISIAEVIRRFIFT